MPRYSRVFHFLWRAESGLFFIFGLYLMYLGQGQFLADPGVFWSTVLGQQILSTGQLPQAETFSCTLAGQPWRSHQWLSQAIMAALFRIGAFDTLVLAAAILLAGLWTWVAHRTIRSGWHWSIAFLLAMLGLLASRWHLHARPHLASILLMGIVFARLLDFEAGRISWPGLLWLPPLFVLWSNLHGGALGGLATLALVVAGWSFAWIVRAAFAWAESRPPGTGPERRPLGASSCSWYPVNKTADMVRSSALLLACGLAALVNPYGWHLPVDWIRLMGSPVVPRYILEHFPLDWGNPYQQPILLFGLIYLVILGLAGMQTGWRNLRTTWLLPVVWFVLTLGRVRHCTLFSITAALALADVLAATSAAVWLDQQGSWLFHRPQPQAGEESLARRVASFLLPGLVVLAAVIAQAAQLPVPVIGTGWARLTPELCPLELLPHLEQYEAGHPQAPIFNDMAYGGFLIWYTPGLRPLLDDRCELYGDDFLRDYFEANDRFLQARGAGLSPEQVRQMPSPIDFWQDRYGIQIHIALVMKESGFHYYLESVPDEWVKVAETSPKHGAALYRRGTR